MEFKNKYLKYKIKYYNLKNMNGGNGEDLLINYLKKNKELINILVEQKDILDYIKTNGLTDLDSKQLKNIGSEIINKIYLNEPLVLNFYKILKENIGRDATIPIFNKILMIKAISMLTLTKKNLGNKSAKSVLKLIIN
jgi:hypothetical protein